MSVYWPNSPMGGAEVPCVSFATPPGQPGTCASIYAGLQPRSYIMHFIFLPWVMFDRKILHTFQLSPRFQDFPQRFLDISHNEKGSLPSQNKRPGNAKDVPVSACYSVEHSECMKQSGYNPSPC